MSAFVNCNKPKENKEENITKKQYLPDKNEVDIIVLDKGIFKKELVSNGRLVALEKSTLKFNVSEKINNIYVKNGDYVKSGQLLASLDAFTYQQKVSKAEIDLKQATLEFNDLQIRRGFNANNIETTNVDDVPSPEPEETSIEVIISKESFSF